MVSELLLLEWYQRLPYISNKLLGSLVLIVLAVIFSQVLLLLFSFYLKHIAKKTETEIDDLIIQYISRPVFYFVLVYGIKLALLNLEIDGIVTRMMSSLMAVVFVFILMRVSDVFIEGWGRSVSHRTRVRVDKVLLPLFHKIVKVSFVIVAMLWVLRIWDVDITPYLAGVGISGLVLGLALQDSLKNIFGGISLLLDKTYAVGDKIKLQTGDVGTIVDIGLRSTKMVTFDNEIIFVPNGYLANSLVRNYAGPQKRIRVRVEFIVLEGEVEKIKTLALDAVKKMPDVLKDPTPEVNLLQIGSGLEFRVAFWVTGWENEFAKKEEATLGIYEALRKAKVELK